MALLVISLALLQVFRDGHGVSRRSSQAETGTMQR